LPESISYYIALKINMKYSEQRYKMQIALNKIKTYSPTASKFYN